MSKTMRYTALIGALGLLVAVLVQCNGGGYDPKKDDNQTSGDIVILCDEAYRAVIEAEREVFVYTYKDARIRIHYLPEAQLLKAMLSDSVRGVIAAVKPGGAQEAYFRSRQIDAPVIPVLTDGIAVVVNKTRTLDSVTLAQLKSLLVLADGESARRWSVLIPGNEDLLFPLFDSRGNGAIRTLVDTLWGGKAPERPLSGLGVNGLDSLIARVERDPRCIGLVPFASISDLDDPRVKAFRERVRLLPVAGSDTSEALLPTQGSLADGRYPLRRTLYITLTEGKAGLGTGFVSFVAGHKGQRIILKQGLAPVRIPRREVMIVNE